MDSSQASHRSPETNDLYANTSSVYIKPPPADEEPFDASPQQQAQEPTVFAPREMASSSRALSEATATATEPQFSEKSADDLIAMIHHLQASHAQELADLRDQQAALSNQLDQMKSLLNSHFTSQLGAIHLLQSNISSLSTPNLASRPSITSGPINTVGPKKSLKSFPTPRKPPIPGSAMSVTSTPAPTPQQEARTTLFGPPLASTPNSSILKGSTTPVSTPTSRSELRIEPSPNPNEPPIVHASHIDTVAEVWEEFRYGRAGNMAVEKLDALWGPRWRQDPKLRVWYQRRKLITDRIKLYMADGIDEQNAVMEVEKMRRGRSLNWVSRILGEDAKETRKQRKVAAQAATAARQALRGDRPAV